MRNLDSRLAAGLASGLVQPFYMAELHFKSGVQRVWSGAGNLELSGLTFTGVGTMTGVGAVTESGDIAVNNTAVSLSGIDPVISGESLNDVQPGLPATLWLGAFDANNNLLGTPYVIFSGIIGQPSMRLGDKSADIDLGLGSKILNFKRASQRKWTSADQRAVWPQDSGFDRVEAINFVALVWK